MYRLLKQRWLYAVAAAMLASALIASVPVSAANGDLVHETDFAAPCGSGIGVGIAFDGEQLWYSCYASSPDLYKANALTGAILASYNVAGGLGALAWDGKRKKIWAGWGGGVGSDGDIRLIDPVSGAGSVVFNATAAATIELDDGLAYDAKDDTLLISPDVSQTIYKYSVAGALLSSFGWHGSGCFNSGVAIGGELLFEGSNGCNHVWVVRRDNFAPVFDFGTGAGGVRDEDLECDSVTFSPKTVMWSVEAYEPRRAVAFEIPPGSCATGGGVDSDGDALLDEWETNGVTIDPDASGPVTPQFVDLPAMGADKNKPDIFLEIDWMGGGAHSHALSNTAIKKVVDAFAASPYVSPTGSVGINMHVDQGPGSIMNFSTNATWGTLSRGNQLAEVANLGTGTPSTYNWSAFDALKNTNFTPTGRTPIFHYVISGHNYDSTTSSGLSRGFGASDLIVSLGSFANSVGTDNQQAGTLMHELGHNLGLKHGGGDHDNYKPNYLSIMNYGFQLDGLIKNGVAGTFDYSRSALASLNENSLSEPAGIGAPGYGTRHWCPASGAYVAVANAGGAIDWNCNGNSTETGVSFDVNNEAGNTTLNGYNDWANITFKGGAIGLAGAAPDLPMETESDTLTVEAAAKIPPLTQFTFTGFFSPVDNPPTVNAVKAGSAIPVKFSLGGNQGLDIFAAGSPYSQQIACDSGAPVDDIEQTVNPGQATLTYDPLTDQYTYVWKTSKPWSGTCRRLTVQFRDGSQQFALFKLK
ncbi:hypothetical protein Rhe02_56090 [Rhizocola hellebori]|uniref:Uncharacterized protein n=1 Tax=Rhizocola hellebori TaxID=1392758 RepID=A0A8J3VIM2_9ACTN|nr:PxKF domain-containing protein [Rhizocola hellebori]GIH07542.1 hypothetical protein Rhe02_56090 [Rhizocola hellebori]